MIRNLMLLGTLIVISSAPALARTIDPRTVIVCPTESKDRDCRYRGGEGVQHAIDAAGPGDTIRLKAGRYSAQSFRDVPFKIHMIRGFLVVDGKDLALVGDEGAVLDGSVGPQTTAIVANNAHLRISGLTITGFRWGVQEDETYDGHGIFAINSRVSIKDTVIEKFLKMGLVGRGTSMIDATNLRIQDGHVGIWLREKAYLRMSQSVVRNIVGSGLCAYDQSITQVSNAVFDATGDDALYTEQDAIISGVNMLIAGNKPYAARALERSRISLDFSVLFKNEQVSLAKDNAAVNLGAAVIQTDPLVDLQFNPKPGSPLSGMGDPEIRTKDNKRSDIGLQSSL